MSNVIHDIYGEEVGTMIGNAQGNIIKVRMKHNYMDPRFIEKDDKLEIVMDNLEEIYSIFNFQLDGGDVILTLEKIPNIKAF